MHDVAFWAELKVRTWYLRRPRHCSARNVRVLRPLDEGGMGAPYLVEQLSTGNELTLP
ncbi:MAG: hypothetical protein ACLQVI_09870 [Polyangiaceae bacterium]